MNRLSKDRQELIIKCLVDGCSIRATARITGHARNTISALLVKVGMACKDLHDKKMRNIKAARIEADEMWGFCGCKDKGLKKGKQGIGSVWTWLAIDPDTKLVASWLLGRRTDREANALMYDLSNRLAGQPSISTDGLPSYQDAVLRNFGSTADLGQVVKQYTNGRYSGSIYRKVTGTPLTISTSIIERFNLTIRQSMKRWQRRTLGFSKSKFHMECAMALFIVFYNFARQHDTLAISPAMESGIETTLWDISDIVALVN